ncbi:MAG: DUF4331 domain-containing protein [Dokdonella sp.]|uniref:DUF4331 domain-containing protein n=1 Tax=Dokdonella sp. TaxID=2291710 RepID=UPI0032656E7D
MRYQRTSLLAAAITGLLALPSAFASSHREAPFVAGHPKVDATDFYMFRSYENGRDGYVTIVANYEPLQDSYGGPNYFALDPNALYEIHIDNNGDAKEDITFQFKFTNTYNNAALTIGGKSVPVPLELLGPIGTGITSNDANKNLIESYVVNVIRGDRRSGTSQAATNLSAGGTSFRKPLDNIGTKSIPDYAGYAASHIASIGIPGCDAGKVFVGQRADPFAVNLGEVFDLVNLNPIGEPDAEPNTLADKAVTAIELEVPVGCLAAGGSPIIGGWTTASLRQATVLNPAPKGVIAGATATQGPSVVGGAWTQVSRLGAPLVNELVIGLPDKDRFNASQPKDDGQFADYVTNPTLPALLQVLFGVQAPQVFPRTDLIAAFLTGVTGLNQPAGVTPSEMLRLNTSIAPKTADQQANLGVLAGDTAGFPNGRRPGDDVVDIELRVAMGVLLPVDQAPSGQGAFTDQTTIAASDFPAAFPYLNTPLPGSPNSANGTAVAKR